MESSSSSLPLLLLLLHYVACASQCVCVCAALATAAATAAVAVLAVCSFPLCVCVRFPFNEETAKNAGPKRAAHTNTHTLLALSLALIRSHIVGEPCTLRLVFAVSLLSKCNCNLCVCVCVCELDLLVQCAPYSNSMSKYRQSIVMFKLAPLLLLFLLVP